MVYERPVGLTKSVGYEFGLRRTVSVPLEEVWEFLFFPTGIARLAGGMFGI